MHHLESIDGVKSYFLQGSKLEVIAVENEFCEAVIALQGAQVLEFKTKKGKNTRNLLWLSNLNEYQLGTAIRGGIPLCFPWFGGHATELSFPSHGFARNSLWQLNEIVKSKEDGHILTFQLEDSNETRRLWNYPFLLQMVIHCSDKLQLTFKLTNTGSVPFHYHFAWHSYFPVDIETASIYGLQNTTYIDQLKQMQKYEQTDDAIRIQSEVDRIYPHTKGSFEIHSQQQSPIYIQSSAKSTVVWNPWINKTQRLKDIENDAWRYFVCLESGQIHNNIPALISGETMSYMLTISE